MNDQGRKQIAKWKSALEDIKGEVETLAEEEREKFDNLSEGLQQAERGQALETAADNLDSIVESMDELIGKLDEVEI